MQCCAEEESAEPLQEGAFNKKLYSRDLKRSVPQAWLFVRPINIVTGVLGTRWRMFVFLK